MAVDKPVSASRCLTGANLVGLVEAVSAIPGWSFGRARLTLNQD